MKTSSATLSPLNLPMHPSLLPRANETQACPPAPQHLLYAVAVSAYLNNDNRALNLFLQNPTVSAAEKALIRSRKEMKMGRYEDARELLESFTTDSDLLTAERHFLFASLHAHVNRWELSVQDGQQSIIHYLLCHNERGLFLSHYNLSVSYSRMEQDALSSHHLDEAATYAKTPSQRFLLHRTKACQHSRLERYPEMIQEIDVAMELRLKLDETERASLDAIASDLYFRGGELDKALCALENLVTVKTARDRARARLDLILLTALIEQRSRLIEGEPPPVINENFEYRARWKVILNLQNGDWLQAQAKWNELQKTFPLRYAPELQCLNGSDERTIFMTAVRSLMTALRR